MNEVEIRNLVQQIVDSITDHTGEFSSSDIVGLGADHGGYKLKSHLMKFLQSNGYAVHDFGTYSQESVDYPDFAEKVARAVSSGQCYRGIVIDGAGIGSSIAANKIKGVRAGMCYNEKTILNSRLHNNANVLTLGASFHGESETEKLVKLWLETEFEGGRHQKRIDKITALENCKCK